MAGLSDLMRDPAGVWRGMDQGQRLALMVGAALLVSIAAATYMWASAPTFVPLYRGLSPRSGGHVIAALDRMNVPYRVKAQGSIIEVPGASADQVRLKLAAKNLPASGESSFKDIGSQSLGESRFAQRVQYQHGLGQALEHTIESLDAVSSARVNLAIAKRPVFVGDSRKSTASVLVRLKPGESLNPGQVAGIQHLVASSTVGLSDKDVAVVNQDGTLLSGAALASGAGPGQLSYEDRIEKRLRQQILALLRPITGPGHVRVSVAAKVNFAKVKSATVTYGKSHVVSEQSRSSGSSLARGAGIPGAVSNKPPGGASAPFAASAAAAAGAAAAGKPPGEKNRTVNFQNDRKVTQRVAPPGVIKRLSIAVLLDKPTSRGGKGSAAKSGAPGKGAGANAARMARISKLVKNAVGFDAKRGDSISVTSMPFAPPQAAHGAPQPWWKSPLASMGLKYAAGLVAFLLAWLILIRPIMRAALRRIGQERAEPQPQLSASAAMEAEAQQVAASEAALSQRLRETHDVVEDDPAAVAKIIRSWMSDGG